MEDIGTKDNWAAAQRVLIFSRVLKGMGVPTENSEEPNAESDNTKQKAATQTPLASEEIKQLWEKSR
jgi:hypothetical protein